MVLTFEFCAAFLSLIVYATVTGRLIANLQMWLFFYLRRSFDEDVYTQGHIYNLLV